MISIDINKHTYLCPFCGCVQSFYGSFTCVNNGIHSKSNSIPERWRESSFSFYTIECSNAACNRISVLGINRTSKKQVDIVPQVTIKSYPNYIPEQIRNDYSEAVMIIDASPKAAATLFRRCLQGMIRDFWGIKAGRLYDEISELQEKVSVSQWAAIDALRKVGNIGAHMEKDVNTIVDIEPDEARKLMKLIELLFEKWYIARHDEEKLLGDIVNISSQKEVQRKK